MHFFPTNLLSSGQLKMMQRHYFFNPPSPFFLVIFATATVLAFVLLRNSMFNFHCYTQREATPIQKSARKWRCDLSRLLEQKITKGIHSCKPDSLNCPKDTESSFSPETWLQDQPPSLQPPDYKMGETDCLVRFPTCNFSVLNLSVLTKSVCIQYTFPCLIRFPTCNFSVLNLSVLSKSVCIQYTFPCSQSYKCQILYLQFHF